MRRRRKFLIWMTLVTVPVVAALSYYLIPVQTKVAEPIKAVREAMTELYPQYDFKTATDNGTYFHGDTRKAREHPAYEGWGHPGWNLDVEYRAETSQVFEVEIANFAKFQSRRTLIRAEALNERETRIVVTSNQYDGLSDLNFRNPIFSRARLREIRGQLERDCP